MKAIVCSDFGPIQNIEYKDVKEPIIQSESVIINVKSVGVNFPDGLLVQGLSLIHISEPTRQP